MAGPICPSRIGGATRGNAREAGLPGRPQHRPHRWITLKATRSATTTPIRLSPAINPDAMGVT